MNPHELKQLQVIMEKKKAELGAAKKEQTDLSVKASEIGSKATDLKNEIQDIVEKLSKHNSEPTISEHALIRYCQRVLNIDTDKIIKEILDEKTIDQIKTISSGKIPKDDYIVVVKNNVVVSIFLDEKEK